MLVKREEWSCERTLFRDNICTLPVVLRKINLGDGDGDGSYHAYRASTYHKD